MGASGPFVTILRILQPPQQLSRPEPFPGQQLSQHPVDLRPRDPGHHFPPNPVAGSAEKRRPAGRGPRGDASRPRCGSRTRPAPHRSAQSRTPFRYATGSLPRRPGFPVGYPPERWTGSSAARCPPDSGDSRGPVDLAGLPPAGGTHPLGAEPVAAGTLGTLGHVISCQAASGIAAALSPLSAAARPPAWVCGAPPGPGRPTVRSSSSGHTVKPAGTSRT